MRISDWSSDVCSSDLDALLPFRKDGSAIKTRDMNLHRLPWPRAELAALGELDVELRITLSYFIEPNPGERGWTRRSAEHTSELQSLMRISYAVLCLNKKSIEQSLYI